MRVAQEGRERYMVCIRNYCAAHMESYICMSIDIYIFIYIYIYIYVHICVWFTFLIYFIYLSSCLRSNNSPSRRKILPAITFMPSLSFSFFFSSRISLLFFGSLRLRASWPLLPIYRSFISPTSSQPYPAPPGLGLCKRFMLYFAFSWSIYHSWNWAKTLFGCGCGQIGGILISEESQIERASREDKTE